MIAPIKGAAFRYPKVFVQQQKEIRQMGPLLQYLHPVVPDNGWFNTVAAFRKRCNYYSPARASPFVISSSLDFIHKLCPVKMENFDWTEMLYKNWLAKFGEEKVNRMNKSLETLPFATLADYSSKSIFVKVEALLVGHKPNWAPRVIFKGTDLYNAISGPIFNELMRRLDYCLNHMRGPYRFMTSYKKTPNDYVPILERQHEDEFWLEADFSSNDKYQCSDVMLLETALMRVLGCPEWFVRLHLKTNKFTVKSSKQGISATVENQLPTGATDTTFRNTFWNGCILWTFLRKTKPKTCRAMLLGDDMLAAIRGECKYAVKVYESLASDARMEAKVIRHSQLYTATFLSKFFVPTERGVHLTVPILGKALGRFNMRANLNDAVSDHAYMAGKSVGYAYEFRFIPTIRNMFLERFKHEFGFLHKKELGRIEVDVSWNAKNAGVTLKNITKKLVEKQVISDGDFLAFCYMRYGLMASDVYDLFEQVVVNDQKIDMHGTVVAILAQDFLEGTEPDAF